ncbi:hypothetical protein I204_06552 [Kwoniella mangroviensis CBS 8886]|nr:hypothetical protein I204_06552 [Kwoniella mangroviensis CBS 8886]
MPIILASLVFAFALAALPSTEPFSPDEQEQAEYVAYLSDKREKRRRRIMQKEEVEERRSNKVTLDVDERRRTRGEELNLENDDRRTRKKCDLGLGLNLPFDESNGSSRGRLISDICPTNEYKKTHLRRSSSVPSLSSTSSASSSSRDSSPGSSPKRFSATLV